MNKEVTVHFVNGHQATFQMDKVVFYIRGPVREWLEDGYTVINVANVSLIEPVEQKDGDQERKH